MRSVRANRFLRLLAAALVVWLVADALSHGACTHDVIAFARASRSEVSHPLPGGHSDSADPAHCSCHWQFVPAPQPLLVDCPVSAPLDDVVVAWMPEPAGPTLERPPQRA
jgi:hypothetical protein